MLLVNETTGSGGDLLAWMFRQSRLGPLVGKRTWGGTVGLFDYPVLMDGGRVTAPDFAHWSPRDGWIIENEGVPPDVEVEQARTILETTRAQMIDVGVARAQYEHAVAVLIGKPAADFSLSSMPLTTPPAQPRVVDKMVLHVDMAPSLLDLCGAKPLEKIDGKSWRKLAGGDATGWRNSWFYEYNYEKQFPYTPNVRGVRTDEWKFIHYPHGDGKPDRHKAELYHLTADPEERKNLIADPSQAERIKELQAELARLMRESGIDKDVMPLDAGIKKELPDLKIR